MPYAQGELDNLCGLYAIVNAVEATAAPWTRADADGLFQHLVSCLASRRRLQAALKEGIAMRELCCLLDHAGTYLRDGYGLKLKRRIAFARCAPLSLYWQRLQEHLQETGQTAIIGLWGVHEHWSCLSSITPRTLWMSDSDRNPIRRLYRAHCTTSRPRRQRHHELAATQTILLILSPMGERNG